MAESANRFLDLLRVLARYEVEHVIVGGVAGVLAGVPLTTFDLDIVFARTPENIERLLGALHEINAHYRDPAGRRIHPDAEKLDRFRLNLFRTDLGDLDVLPKIAEDFDYANLAGRTIEYRIDGLSVQAIDLPTLIEAKEYAGRPKDQYALLFLREALHLQNQKDS